MDIIMNQPLDEELRCDRLETQDSIADDPDISPRTKTMRKLVRYIKKGYQGPSNGNAAP